MSSVSCKQKPLRDPDEQLYKEGRNKKRPHVAATGVIAASGRCHRWARKLEGDV